MKASVCVAVSAVFALSALSACTAGSGGTATSGASSSPIVTAAPSGPPTPVPTTEPSTTVPPTGGPTTAPAAPTHTTTPVKPPAVPIRTTSAGRITLSGEIFPGAEPTCLLLTQQKITYLLLAPDSAQLHPGERVVVTGTLAPSNIATHCMQGKPFEVATSDILGPN